jgi:hypothetical protein
VLQINTFRGVPNGAAGDLVTLSYPYETVPSYSKTFVIN